MPKLTVNDIEVEVEEGATVLHACEAANVEIPSKGKNTNGNKAVTNKGIASEAHKTAIKIPTAATYHAS